MKAFTRPRRRLRFSHDDAELESLLLCRGDIFDLAMMMPTRKGFYSAVGTSMIEL